MGEWLVAGVMFGVMVADIGCVAKADDPRARLLG